VSATWPLGVIGILSIGYSSRFAKDLTAPMMTGLSGRG
jgi:hypothetical protein